MTLLLATILAAPARGAVRIIAPERADPATPRAATMSYPGREGEAVVAPFVSSRRALTFGADADGAVRFTLRSSGRPRRVLVDRSAPYVVTFRRLRPATYTLTASMLRGGARDRITGVRVGDVVVAVGDSLVQNGLDEGLVAAGGGSFEDAVAHGVRHPVYLFNRGYGQIISDGYLDKMRSDATWQATMNALRPNRALVMLGTNDGAANRGAGQLTGALGQIVDILERRGIHRRSIILSAPPFTTRASLISQIRSFQAPVHGLATSRGLVRGPDFFGYFRARSHEISADEVHPTAEGFRAMGRLWGRALVRRQR